MSGDGRAGSLRVLAHDIRSMHNVGAIFRTADGAGCDGIILSGITGAPPDPRIAKVALGAEESVPWVRVDDREAALRELHGSHVIVLEQADDATCVDHLNPPRNGSVVLCVGGELEGVPDWLSARADTVAEVPMFGSKESLNVSVAFGIAIYAVALRRREGREGLLAARGRRPVREGVLTRGVSTGPMESPSPRR